LIRYLACAGHDRYTMRRFRRSWAGAFRGRIRIYSYERPPRRAAPGLWIFSDLERLRPSERSAATEMYARLAAAGPAFRVLNDPRRALGRLDLLRALAARGLNAFRAWRVDEPLAGARFPVFVRAAESHEGSLTGLLQGPEEVARAIRGLGRRRGEDLLVVEFLDTSDGYGTFRKYSAMRIGPALFPRHLLFDARWVVKRPVLVDDALLREEQEFLDSFPHKEQVARAFEIAGIEYGRIDYGLLDGRIQVWEINTNPVLIPAPRSVAPARLPRNLVFAKQACEAMRALEEHLPAGEPVPLPAGGSWLAALRSRLFRP
jgi:hypothetical protein